MKQAEIDALLHAHHGNSRAVAFLHVLRQTQLDDADQAFLEANASNLAPPDLLRWRSRTPPVKRAPILVALAEMAKNSPSQFEHEVLNAPGTSFDEREWETLADIVADKVPPALFARIQKHETGAPKPVETSEGNVPTEGSADLSAMFDLDDGLGAKTGDGSLFGGDSLGDALGLDLEGEEGGGPLFADPFAGLSLEQALAKMLSGQNGDERAMLLDWIEAHGLAKTELMSAALMALKRGPVSSSLFGWYAKRLSTKEAWLVYGRAFVSAMIERRAFAEMQELLAIGLGFSDEVLDVALEQIGQTLIDETRAALRAARVPDKTAYGLLAAFSCLEPTADMKKRLGALKQAAKRSENAPQLIPLIDRLVRLGREKTPRGAPLEGLIAAVHTLSDTLGQK